MKTRLQIKNCLLLGVLLLSILLSACAPTVPQETSSSDETSGTTGTGENTENKNNGTEEKKEGFWSGEDLMFYAYEYLTNPGTSLSPSFTVVVYDHRIYLRDVLFNKVTYTEDINWTLAEYLSWNSGGEIGETLEAIKNLKNCYILESDVYPNDKIAVYEFEDAYYFLCIGNEDEVAWILRGNVNETQHLDLHPKLYLQPVGGDWKYSLNIYIYDGKLEVNGYTYIKTANIESLNLTYSDALLAAANGDVEILKTLDTIKNQKPYCILKSSNDTDKEYMGYILAIYEIDDVYYFLDYYKSGDIAKIWRQSYRGVKK